ncbi:MAG: glycosyltransferase, partial [Candidatus Lloydbacteria bacterium]|nr:glycosyltransferase [Candidatus Lloydbacteria bacterium]
LHLPKFFFVGTLNALFYQYLVWLYKKADMLVYPSEFAKKIFEERFKIHLAEEVISNGVDISKFKKTDIEARRFIKKFSIDKSVINFLYVGRLHPEKSIDTLIRATAYAIQKNPHIKTYIVGEGHMRDSLEYLTNKLGLKEQVLFLGKLHDDDLIGAYNASDSLVLPSLAELEGMVALEAMACGKPLIIADSKESASVYFINGNGFLFKPKDPIDLAEKMLRLADDKAGREKMGEMSLKKSREYDINQSVTKLEELYYRLTRIAHPNT